MNTADQDLELRHLLDTIHAKYQHDFRNYAYAPLKRRLAQLCSQFGVSSIAGLHRRISSEPVVFDRVLSSLTIQFSGMFRDPQFYRTLRQDVVPFLSTYPSIRLWVAGCSRGEEVYSLAILLHEHGLLRRTFIYATDISQTALEAAERGIYRQDSIAEFSAAYLAAGGKAALSDYYTLAYGAARFDPALRRNVLFTEHSLASDSVFAEVQLVSCRNVLIYFDRTLQQRTLGLFHEALTPKGFLCLGARETLAFSGHARSFSEYARPHRIYQKR